MRSFSMDTRLMSSSLLVNSLVKNLPFKTTPHINEPPFQLIYAMGLSTRCRMTVHFCFIIFQETLISFFGAIPFGIMQVSIRIFL